MKQQLPKHSSPEPTRSELEILQVLWQNGPNTVRFVNDQLNKTREVNYTTTLKLLQIMLEKNMVTRDESQMKHIYAAALPMEDTQSTILKNLVNTAFGGSASSLVLRMLGNAATSREELDKIKDIIKRIEEDKK